MLSVVLNTFFFLAQSEKSTTPVPKAATPNGSISKNNNLPKTPLGPPYPYGMHGGPPGHPGLPADLSAAAAAAAGLGYPGSLGLHNNLPPGLNNYPRGLVN